MDLRITSALYVPIRIHCDHAKFGPQYKCCECLGVFENERKAQAKMWADILNDNLLPECHKRNAQFFKEL